MIRLKELREELNVDQKVLAIDLKVSQPTISDWESGKKKPSIENALRLADYFHVSLDYLVGRTMQKGTPSAIDRESFRDDEKNLLAVFRQLNQGGRSKLLGYANDLVSSGNYKVNPLTSRTG